MSESPKKIWVGDTEESSGYWVAMDAYSDTTPYIREDLVLELVEALNLFIEKYPSMFGYPGEPQVKIKRALAKLVESHEKYNALLCLSDTFVFIFSG